MCGQSLSERTGHTMEFREELYFQFSFLSFPDTGFKEGCLLVRDFQIEEMWN